VDRQAGSEEAAAPLDEEPSGGPPAPPPRRSLLRHPLLYVVLVIFLLADSHWEWLPAPGRATPPDAVAEPSPQTLDEMLRDQMEVQFAAAVLLLVPLMLGSGLLLGYFILRSCNIRVFPRCEFPLVPWTGWHLVRCGIVFVVLTRLGRAGVAWLQELRPGGFSVAGVPESIVLVLASNLVFVAGCLFVMALVASGGESPFRRLGLSEKRWPNRAAVGVAGWVMIFPLVILAGYLTSLYGPLVGIRPEQQEVLVIARDVPPRAFAILVFSAVVVAPLTEELLFRGFLYATLRRYMGPLGAICLSAAAFALMHGFAFGFPMLFVLGFLLAYLYERMGSLAASIVAHAAHNLYQLIVIYAIFR